MAVTTVTEDFLLYCRARGLSSAVVRQYRWTLEKLGDPAMETADILRLYVQLEPQLGPVSLVAIDRNLRVFYKWLASEDLWPNIMAKVPRRKAPKSFPRVFTRPELTAISTAARSDPRDAALIAFLLGTGARIGEAANLRWRDVRMGSVTISGKTGPRPVPLPAQAQRLMAGLGDGDAVWVGPRGPLTTAGLRQVVEAVIRRAGVTGKRASAHTFRHTFATEYLRLGGSLQKLQDYLGHSEITTTMVYVHMTQADLMDGAEQFSPLQLVELEPPDTATA